MAWGWAIVGALLAAAIDGDLFAFGALLGWLLGERWRAVRRLNALEERVRTLELDVLQARGVRGIQAPQAALKARSAEPDPKWPPATEAAHTVRPESAPPPPPAVVSAEPQLDALLDTLARQTTARPEPVAPVRAAVTARAEAVPAFEPVPDTSISSPWDWIEPWLKRANWPVVLGGLMLFVGVAALLRYAVSAGWFTLPPVFRITGIAVLAAAALAWAWRQREQRRAFALALQGVALGVLLIDVYAALRLYALLTPGMAFGCMVLVVALGVWLALLQDAMVLALLSAAGGFAAPLLASTGSGNPLALFSYLLVLNFGILAVALARRWPWLMRLGFVGTFVLGSAWGLKYYQPVLRQTVEPFLLAFAAIYIALVCLSTRRSRSTPGEVEPGIVFATPLVCSLLLALLWPQDDRMLALHALGAAFAYGGLWWWMRSAPQFERLRACFMALALGFATLAIPLALGAKLTAACYAMEGAGLVWYALRDGDRRHMLAGVALQLAAGVAWFDGVQHPVATPWVNGHSLGALMLALAAGLSGWWADVQGRWSWLGRGGAWLGCAWLLLGLAREVDLHGYTPQFGAFLVLLAAVSTLGAVLATRWQRLREPLLLLQALMVPGLWAYGAAFAPLLDVPHLWATGSVLLAWFVIAVLSRHDLHSALHRRLSQHLWQFALLAILSADWAWRASQWLPLHTVWTVLALALPWIPAITLMLVRPQWLDWPQGADPRAGREREIAAAWLLSLGLLLSLGHPGRTHLAHLPLLNPLELLQIVALTLLLALSRRMAAVEWQRPARVAATGLAFAALSMAVVRATARAFDLPWNEALWDATVIQTALALTWAVLGVAGMVLGNRWHRALLWRAGAALMVVVALKLLLIDRQYLGSLAGISAFIGVGVLLVAVAGFLAPEPPSEPPGPAE